MSGLFLGAALTAIALVPALAQPDRPPQRPPETVANKVNQAHFVFLGRAKRIYFVDERLAEISDEAASPAARARLAICEVEVLQTAYPPEAAADKLVKIAFLAMPGADVEGARKRLLGKEHVYFTRVEQVKRTYAPDGTPVNLAKPAERHFYVKAAGFSGPLENPLPPSYWSEARNEARLRIEREQKQKQRRN